MCTKYVPQIRFLILAINLIDADATPTVPYTTVMFKQLAHIVHCMET